MKESCVGIFIILIKITIYRFMCLELPIISTPTWIAILCVIFENLGFAVGANICGFLCVLFMFISIPYWILVIVHKHKQKLKWHKILKYYLKWFLKGPFAYPEILTIANENNLMPKMTKFLNKIVFGLKNIFSKIKKK